MSLSATVLFVLASLAPLAGGCTALQVRGQVANDRVVWGHELKRPYPAVHWFYVSTFREGVEVRWKYGATKGPDRDRFDAGGPTHFRWNVSPPASLPVLHGPPAPWERLGFVAYAYREEDRGNVSAGVTVAAPYWFLSALATPVKLVLRPLGAP